MRRINRAARAHGRSVGQSDAHARTGQDDGREGRAWWLPVPATPHPHRTSKHDKRPPPRPAARPPALAGAPRHIFHRQTANSGPTPLGAPRTTGEPPRRWRGTGGISPRWPSHWRPTPPACRCTPRLARSHRIINAIAFSSSATLTSYLHYTISC